MKKTAISIILTILIASILHSENLTLTFTLEDFTFTKQNTYNVINPPKNNNYV